LLSLVVACIGGWLALAPAAVLIGRSKAGRPVVYAGSLGIALILLGAALTALLSRGDAPTMVLPLGLPWLGTHLRLDSLAAFFLIVIALGSGAASLYGLGYGRHEHAPLRVLPFFPAFLAGMTLVVVANDAFTFLVSWEFMSLVSWALVMSGHREPQNVRAGFVYLVMASFGTLALLLAFGLLAGPDGGYVFDTIRAGRHGSGQAALILALAIFGAGSKAGLAPLHVWLPLAHPAAPSHVSALMSGVMTKVAIYGFIRIVFDLLHVPSWWSSMIVLGLAGATAVLGVLYALVQRDLKRLLAYSTVENIGIVFIGLGLALAFQANGMIAAASLAMTAALLHVFNHSLFKSLLFFGAGAVLTSTGERDMEQLGGLIHRMPVTAFAFLAGAVAISALPPLNGFVSEWLAFQAILLGPDVPQWGLKLMIPGMGAILAFAAALAAACFVTAFGITFLGRARSRAAEVAHETDLMSRTAMLILAGLCLLAGIVPGFAIDALAPVTRSLIGGEMPEQARQAWLTIIPIAASRSSYNGLLVFLFIALSSVIGILAIHRFASHKVRRAPAWDCGFPDPSPATQYTAGSFAQPIRRVYGAVAFRAREKVDMPAPGDIRPAGFALSLHDVTWETLYAPIARVIDVAAKQINRLQFLTIRRYLGLVFAALIALLLVLALWQ
jgi:formate hydrogenlyase subunit 3/multisubunit Na+/H+ antiporter MnhD subunit